MKLISIFKKIFVSCMLLTPLTGFAMEGSPDDEAREIVSLPRHMAQQAGHGAQYVVQTALEYPKITIILGAGVCGAMLYRRYFASQKDLRRTGRRLNKHRAKERTRVDKVKKVHDADTKEQFKELFEANKVVAQKLKGVNVGLIEAQNLLQKLFEGADGLGLKHTAVFATIRSLMQNQTQQGDQIVSGLQSMNDTAGGIVNHQGEQQEELVTVLIDLDTVESDLRNLLQSMREEGKDVSRLELLLDLLPKLAMESEKSSEDSETGDVLSDGTGPAFNVGPSTKNSNN